MQSKCQNTNSSLTEEREEREEREAREARGKSEQKNNQG
jgi:hypothetical protein